VNPVRIGNHASDGVTNIKGEVVAIEVILVLKIVEQERVDGPYEGRQFG